MQVKNEAYIFVITIIKDKQMNTQTDGSAACDEDLSVQSNVQVYYEVKDNNQNKNLSKEGHKIHKYNLEHITTWSECSCFIANKKLYGHGGELYDYINNKEFVLKALTFDKNPVSIVSIYSIDLMTTIWYLLADDGNVYMINPQAINSGYTKLANVSNVVQITSDTENLAALTSEGTIFIIYGIWSQCFCITQAETGVYGNIIKIASIDNVVLALTDMYYVLSIKQNYITNCIESITLNQYNPNTCNKALVLPEIKDIYGGGFSTCVLVDKNDNMYIYGTIGRDGVNVKISDRCIDNCVDIIKGYIKISIGYAYVVVIYEYKLVFYEYRDDKFHVYKSIESKNKIIDALIDPRANLHQNYYYMIINNDEVGTEEIVIDSV